MAELEGFICPMCMMSLPGVTHLEKHVREEHSDSATGKMKANFKQFIGKAKHTLTSKTRASMEDSVSEGAAAVSNPRSSSDRDETGDISIVNVSGINTELWPEQEFGRYRDHLDKFRKERDARVQRIVVETNRLLVRLEKLLRLLKNEHTMKSKQLKALEQDIVPWKKDSEQKRCMKCSREFNLRHRKHHCRLCGDIICKSCSNFFPISEAYQLMVDNPDYSSLKPDPGAKTKKRKLRKVLKDDDNDDDDEDFNEELRVCPTCEELLVRQLSKVISQGKTILSALYEKMQLAMRDADRLKPDYLEMADSLLNGHYHFRLVDAHARRQDLVKMYEVVDSVSKQIINLKYDDGRDPSPTCQKIQRNIRVYASTYLQENLFTLPGLPTKDKLKEIREAKEKEAEERKLRLAREKEMKREQEAAAAAAKKESSLSKLEASFSALDTRISLRVSPTFTKKAKAVLGIKKAESNPKGWTAESTLEGFQDDGVLDPFELQRKQLLGYISQAEQAKRYDEVATLKESLREIEYLMKHGAP